MAKLVKNIGKSEKVRGLLCWLGAWYIRFLYATGRWQVENDALPKQLWAEGKPFILSFWHGRILMMPYVWNHNHPIDMLISQHRDGQIIARTVGHFGIRTVAGSTSRGGAGALRAMVKILKNGGWVGITPDGPRGPRQRASMGAVSVARLAGVPILPATFSTACGRNLKSWDRFLLAHPFSRGIFVWGDPIEVPGDADEAALKDASQALEDEMNRILHYADTAMGRTPVMPDEKKATAEGGE